jgi:N2-acetyl-L-2,4-diaminobutanoate deacetylase
MWKTIRPADFDPTERGSGRQIVQLGETPDAPRLTIAQGGTGSGPRVLVCGGTHGDEFEGQIAALELARGLDALTIEGRVIVIPFHHEAACRAGSRLSPVDGKDLNRLYGIGADPWDGPSAEIAAFIETCVLPEIDIVIDLHSGGESHDFILSSNLQASLGSAEHRGMLPALLAFDAPYAIVFDEAGDHAMPHRGTLEGAARALGKQAISSELGGGGRTTPRSLAVARQGLINLLHHFGVVRSPLAMEWRESRSILLALDRPEQHLTAPASGWFAPAVTLGDAVTIGDKLGEIIVDDAPFDPPLPVLAETDGIVAALARSTRQTAGNTLVFVARPLNRQL